MLSSTETFTVKCKLLLQSNIEISRKAIKKLFLLSTVIVAAQLCHCEEL